MKQGPTYRPKLKRHRLGITDYRKRKRLLKSRKVRVVVRKSLRYMRVQFVKYNENGDKILTSAISSELDRYGWDVSRNTTPAAYLTGLLVGKRARENGIKECILDIGRYSASRGSRVFAVAKGIIDAGVECSVDDSMFPDEDRLKGVHLRNKPSKSVDDIKSKILGGER